MTAIRLKIYLFCILIGTAIILFPVKSYASENKVGRIILVDVGGLNHEAYLSTAMNNLRKLSVAGSMAEKALAIRSDTVEAAQASLLTSALIEDHKHLTVKDRVDVESIFDILKSNGKSVLLVDGAGGKVQSFARSEKEYMTLGINTGSKELFEKAFTKLSENNAFFTYIYIDDCASALIRVDQQAYYKALTEFDTQFGVFVNKLKDEDLYNNTLFIITSARSSSPSDMVPLLIWGPGCKSNNHINGCMIMDVVPTICKMMGLPKPASSRGLPIYAAISPGDGDSDQLFSQWIKDMQVDRIRTWEMNYRLKDELYRTTNQMNAIKQEKDSIFDFAGEKEAVIMSLKNKLNIERFIWGGLILLMLIGYIVEFFWLRKKYLMFK